MSKRPKGGTAKQIQAEPKESAPRAQPEEAGGIFAFPSFAGPRAKNVFIAGAVCALLAAMLVPAAIRRIVYYRQTHLPESAIWNAIHALEGDDEKEARKQVEKALATTIHTELEGNALYYLEPYYQQLSEALYNKGWKPEAQQAAYKAIRHYHRLRRSLEYLDPWIALEKDYAREGDMGRFLPLFDLICSHSLGSNREAFPLLTGPLEGVIEYANYRSAYYNIEPGSTLNLYVHPRAQKPADPDLKMAIGILDVRTYLRMKMQAKAVETVRPIAAQFPGRLDARALVAEAADGKNAAQFAESLKADTRYSVLDFANASPVPTEYDPPRPVEKGSSGDAIMKDIGAVEMEFQADRPAKMVYLVATGTSFVDIYPIVLATIDGGEIYPLYIDHPEPTMFAMKVSLDAGPHRIRLEFLNDQRTELKGKLYDRDVDLIRLVLDHSEPGQPK